jgi:hypothetical protein
MKEYILGKGLSNAANVKRHLHKVQTSKSTLGVFTAGKDLLSVISVIKRLV